MTRPPVSPGFVTDLGLLNRPRRKRAPFYAAFLAGMAAAVAAVLTGAATAWLLTVPL